MREEELETKRQNLQEKEQDRELPRMISAVNEVMRNTALLDHIKSEKELDQVMPVLLASLGNYAEAERSYIFERKPGRMDVVHMTHVWCAEGVSPTVKESGDISLAIVPNWFAMLNQGKPVVSHDWEADKEKWPEEYAVFSGLGIHSIILVPLISGGAVIGYLGIDNPMEERIELAVSLLQGISGHISGLKENLHMMKKLEENQNTLQENLKKLNQEKTILDALSVDYTSFYYCDLETDTFVPLKCADYNNAAVAMKEAARNQSSYSQSIRHYFENFVIKESAPDFLEKLSAGHLKEHLARNERFAYKYRSYPNKAGQQYFEVQVVRLDGKDGFPVIMGYRYIDDLVAEQERQQTKLENALADARINSEIVGTISKLYWLIYRIDLVEKTYEEISAAQETHKLTGKKGYIADIYEEMCSRIVSEEYKETMQEFWDITTLSDRLRDTESVAVEYQTRTGSWNLARIIVKKRDADGSVRYALYVVRKIDKEKQKELEYKQQLVKTAEDARRANLAKTDFLRRMSHDIRTPINGIQGMITIAEHYQEDLEKQKECRDRVKEASGFLLDLVNNILDMNKLESGAIALEHKPFDLLELLGELNTLAKMNAEVQGLQVHIDHTKIQHCHLVGSPRHVKQILQNIDGNAMKYNREGGSVSFSTSEIACVNNIATFQFVCTDTGRGMSKEFLPHIFEAFAQEDTSARTSYMGTGLGMPIAKQLAEMMGGTIAVESELNVGTTFTTTLSFEVDTEYEEKEHVKNPGSEKDLSGVRVLLTEDNELNMEIAKFILEEAGMEVTTAWNGKEAVDIFRSSKKYSFDLILMDVMMPVMDGLTAVRKIRSLKREDAQTIPIFAMTANAFTSDVKESRRAGMNEHLAKPLDENRMMHLIRQYVAR